jgi:broad specificity phosphatase PhoE
VPRLLLVRHGQSTWNAERRWQGHADPPLSDLGRSQAKAAAAAVGGVDAVVASDLQRARETAEIIAAELGIGPVIVVEALRERAAGDWTGMTREEIDRAHPGAIEEGRHPDGYESDEDLIGRAVPMLQAIAERVGSALVVTHGGVIGAVERHLGAEHHRTPNLGGRVVRFNDGRLTLGEQLLLVDPHDVMVTSPPES